MARWPPSASPSLTTLILGFGNPILTDDAIGFVVAREVHRLLTIRGAAVDLAEASSTSLDLLAVVEGYDSVVIVDAMVVASPVAGQLHRLTPAALPSRPTSTASHGSGPRAAFELGRRLGLAIPADVVIYGIEVLEPYEFGTDLTPPLAALVPDLALAIVDREFGASAGHESDMV